MNKKSSKTSSSNSAGTGKSSPKIKNPKAAQPAPADRLNENLPIVGIGASAGGLEALTALFKAMPADTGIGFVVVVHLDPSHISILPDLLQKATSMLVSHAKDGIQVQANQVYIIPPNKEMQILNGQLQLMDQIRDGGLRLPIDTFLRSLALDQENKAIGIILSGTGTDGTLGIKAIKGEAGLVVVQDDVSAKYDGMPHSAISTGLADYILPPEKIPEKLISYCTRLGSRVALPATIDKGPLPNALLKIFTLIRGKTGHDFSLYKLASIHRRIQRRMAVHQLGTLSHYVHLLQDSNLEVDLLVKELLIGVTHFFRDSQAFLELQHIIEERIIPNHSGSDPVRVWIPGCSTGEEAYSVAILFQESLQKLELEIPIQIFATDIDEVAINFARTGRFSKNITADIPKELLPKYFEKEDTGYYRVKKNIREKIVFAQHNLIKDPPFTRLDLLCCRNLLIYFKAELQLKVMPIFHYSLKSRGVLFLGSSETVGIHSTLFQPIQKKYKIYERQDEGGSQARIVIPVTLPPSIPEVKLPSNPEQIVNQKIDVIQVVEAILKQSDAPPCAIINGDADIIYIHGHTGKYLEAAEGRFNFNIVSMIRPALKKGLQNALQKAQTHQLEVIMPGLSLETEGQNITLDLIVKPFQDVVGVRGLLMVTFLETPTKTKAKSKGSKAAVSQEKSKNIKELERELLLARTNLQLTSEEYEAAIEDLKSTNEELQSTNEELETSKEELQSLNEESTTVNSELQTTVSELNTINDDMSNLMDSTEIAMLFLDKDLHIRRFTPRAKDILPLTLKDIERPIQDLASSLLEIDLVAACQGVLETLLPFETPAATKQGRHYLLRIRPYRTSNNVIDGVVVTFEDFTDLKILELYAESVIATIRQPLLVLNGGLQVISLNQSFSRVFNCDLEASVGKHIYQLMGGQWDMPALRKLLEEILPEKSTVEDFRIEHDFDGTGKRTLILNARRLEQANETQPLILLAVEEVQP